MTGAAVKVAGVETTPTRYGILPKPLKVFCLILWTIGIGLFIFSVFCLFIFADKAEYIVPIGTAMLGFAGGFGVGHYKRKN